MFLFSLPIKPSDGLGLGLEGFGGGPKGDPILGKMLDSGEQVFSKYGNGRSGGVWGRGLLMRLRRDWLLGKFESW